MTCSSSHNSPASEFVHQIFLHHNFLHRNKTCRWGARFEEVHPFSAPGQQQLFHREENHRSWWLQHPRVKAWELRKRHEPLLIYAHVQIYENSLRARDTLRSLDFHPSVCCSLLFMRQTNKQININKPQKGHVRKIHVTFTWKLISRRVGVSQGTSPSPCNSRNWANPPGRSGRSDLASVSPATFTRSHGRHLRNRKGNKKTSKDYYGERKG